MEESESEVAQVSWETDNTVSEIDSIRNESENDLVRMKAEIDKRVVHDTTTGEVTIIMPSEVPNKLPVVTDDYKRYKTKVVKENLSDIFKMCEPVSSESELSENEQTPAQEFEDIATDSDWDNNNNDPVIHVQQDNTEQRISLLDDARNTVCPIRRCTFISRKIKHHVQQMHLPRMMWDNPQPPVRKKR